MTKQQPGPKSAKKNREEKLSQKLKENLRRRKAQARARFAADGEKMPPEAGPGRKDDA